MTDDIEAMTDTPRYQIRIGVRSSYIEAQSEPDAGRFVFSYTVTIENTGRTPARLLNRHWVITDAHGKVQEVSGEGVVGKQPYLRPGESFRYTSGTMLETPVGTMEGEYEMLADDGESFLAPIAPFFLAVPRTLH